MLSEIVGRIIDAAVKDPGAVATIIFTVMIVAGLSLRLGVKES